MVNFYPTNPVGSAATPVKKQATRPAAPPNPTDNREALAVDRRRQGDRRRRRNAPRIMDRRTGADRRRSRIDYSV